MEHKNYVWETDPVYNFDNHQDPVIGSILARAYEISRIQNYKATEQCLFLPSKFILQAIEERNRSLIEGLQGRIIEIVNSKRKLAMISDVETVRQNDTAAKIYLAKCIEWSEVGWMQSSIVSTEFDIFKCSIQHFATNFLYVLCSWGYCIVYPPEIKKYYQTFNYPQLGK